MENQDEKDLENLKKLASDLLKAKEAYNLSDEFFDNAMDNILENISKIKKKLRK